MIKQDIRKYMYMLPIAGQMAGQIGLTFFVDTHERLGVLFFSHRQCQALQLVCYKYSL